MQTLDDYLDGVDHLPPAPRILPELLSLLAKENVDSSRVVELIAFDPAVTASVLQLCNSAFLGSARAAEDLQEAVTRLGFRQISRVVASVTSSRMLGQEQAGYGIDRGELWHHSVASALAAQLVARRLGDDEDVVYTATLLHDIGKIILSSALEERYVELVKETEMRQEPLLDTEQRLLGVHHAQVGGHLLKRWRFPSNLVNAVSFHHSPWEATPDERVAALVYLGNMIAHFMGYGYGRQAFALRGRVEALEILEVDPACLPHFMIETFEQIKLVEALFRPL
jgi:putative nucleotidyltransferase with HDIG domain